MSADVIAPIAMLVVLVLVLTFWTLGRSVFLEALFHPLRKAVIKISPDGRVSVQEVDSTEDPDTIESRAPQRVTV